MSNTNEISREELEDLRLIHGRSYAAEHPTIQEVARYSLTLLDANAKLQADLAECYRLSGADSDGNENWRLASEAVRAVREMRESYDAEREIRFEDERKKLQLDLQAAKHEAQMAKEAARLLGFDVAVLHRGLEKVSKYVHDVQADWSDLLFVDALLTAPSPGAGLMRELSELRTKVQDGDK